MVSRTGCRQKMTAAAARATARAANSPERQPVTSTGKGARTPTSR